MDNDYTGKIVAYCAFFVWDSSELFYKIWPCGWLRWLYFVSIYCSTAKKPMRLCVGVFMQRWIVYSQDAWHCDHRTPK